jgi:hypothetical protein
MSRYVRAPMMVAIGTLGVAATSIGLAPAASASVGRSTSLAGYTASIPTVSASRRVASSSTIFKTKVNVPAVTCPSAGTAGLDEGASLFGSNGSAFGEIFISCQSGSVSYEGFIDGGGDYDNIDWSDTRQIAASVGDSLVFTFTIGASSSSAKVDDVTSGVVASFTGLPFSPVGVQVGDQPSYSSSGQLEPVSQFKAIHFSDITYNGSPLGAFGPMGTSLVDSSGHVQIATSNLNSAGNAFYTSFKSSN